MIKLIKSVMCNVSFFLFRIFEYRETKPGLFCLLSSTFFASLAYIGLYLSLLNLVYYSVMIILTFPALWSNVKDHPAIENFMAQTSCVGISADETDNIKVNIDLDSLLLNMLNLRS